MHNHTDKNIKMNNFTDEEIKEIFDKKDPCDMHLRDYFPSGFVNELKGCGNEEYYYYSGSGWDDDNGTVECGIKAV